MALLNREAILKAEDLKTERVKVPEWGGEVMVATMSGARRDAYELSMVDEHYKPRTDGNVRARLLAFCLVDDKGAALFTEADVAALGQKSAAALDRCVQVAKRLNGIGEAEVDEARKN